ncbi:MAG TPA: hypothetical protein VNY33_07460 [Gaiellaceae bacterium]|nr:hypothetical protein [Gaiellaceae bacterium]
MRSIAVTQREHSGATMNAPVARIRSNSRRRSGNRRAHAAEGHSQRNSACSSAP